jgi:glutathione synthase/RimK-type ligase-like ATP-grasp enzyme
MSETAPLGRALILNLRPYLSADTPAGAHNHSNFPQSYKALKREQPLAIDVLLLEHLDFDAIKETIARPDVLVSNFGNAELLAEPGLAEKIRTITDYFGVRLINPPELTRSTARDANWRRIGKRDLVEFPKTVLLPASADKAARRAILATEMDLPLILRNTTGHMGAAMHLVRDEASLDTALEALKDMAAYAIAYHEFQSEDGFWRKYRAYLVEGEMVGVHVMTSADWNVHREGLRKLEAERPELGLYALSEAFGADPLAHVPQPVWDALKPLMVETGLDAIGVDFALRPDGTALIFEMNSAMRVTGGEVVALDALGSMMERAATTAIAERVSLVGVS